MRRVIGDFPALALFAVLPVIIFSRFAFGGQIPFPSNLLASYYQPWISYPHRDYPNGAPNKPMGFDTLRIHYPIKTLAADQISSGRLPLWNPYAFSGTPLLATYQSAVFHPLSALFLFMDHQTAWALTVMAIPFLSALCMYALLRTFPLTRTAAAFGALVFAYSGFSVVWWQEAFMSGYGAMALPLMLLGLRLVARRNTAAGFLTVAAAVTWSVVSGWFQVSLYTGTVTAAYALWLTARKRIGLHELFGAACAAASGLLLSGPHLVPAAEAFMHSARSSVDAAALFSTYLVKPIHLLTLISPDYFGNPATYTYAGDGFYYEKMLWFGIVPSALAFVAALRLRERHPTVLFFSWVAAISFALGVSWPVSRFVLHTLNLPIISVLIPSRIFFLTMVSGSVLAAFALDAVSALSWKSVRTPYIIIGTTLVGAAVWAAMNAANGTASVSLFGKMQLRNLFLPGISLVSLFLLSAVARKIPACKRILPMAVIFLSLVSSIYFARKYVYVSDRRLTYPETPVTEALRRVAGSDRFWSFGEGHMESNFASRFRLLSPEGYDSLYIARYGELLDAANNGGKRKRGLETRADAFIRDTNRIDLLLTDPYRRRLLSLLGVSYIAGLTKQPPHVTETMEPPKELTSVWSDGVYAIYRFTEALPRTFLARDFRVEHDPDAILAAIFSPSTDLRRSVVLERSPAGLTPSPAEASGTATISAYHEDRVDITTQSQTSAILFLSDSHYPGWKAFVDGIETPIYRADYAFRAVVVPEGSHRVTFRYEPVSWTVGLVACGAGLIFLSFLTIRARHIDRLHRAVGEFRES